MNLWLKLRIWRMLIIAIDARISPSRRSYDGHTRAHAGYQHRAANQEAWLKAWCMSESP